MILSFLLRAGAVVGAVYYTNKIGVWGSAEQTSRLYNDLKRSALPHLEKIERSLPFEVPSLPKTGEIRFLAKYYYNQGVKETFHFVEMVPCYAGQLVKKTTDAFNEFASSPPANK